MSSTEQKQRVILVTGANKGIGFEVVKKLVQRSLSNSDDVILLGSRDLKRGQYALKQLGSPPNVHVLEIDTSSKESIAHATNEIKQKYGGRLDITINNAGIARLGDTPESARETMTTNYYGVKILNEHLIPLLRDNGRVINVASEVGSISFYCVSKDLQDQFTSSTLTTEQLDRLVEDFISGVESNTLEKLGYSSKLPSWSYSVSKAAVIALTRIEARQQPETKKIFVYSVTPGYCSTNLSNHASDARPPELGADSILYLIDTPASELENGAFYQDGIKLPQICQDAAKVQGYFDKWNKRAASK
jgi:carbonyl reductase 1